MRCCNEAWILPDTARKSSMVVMSSTASVSRRTCFSQISLNTSMFSSATFDLGRAARILAAFITCWRSYTNNTRKVQWNSIIFIQHQKFITIHVYHEVIYKENLIGDYARQQIFNFVAHGCVSNSTNSYTAIFVHTYFQVYLKFLSTSIIQRTTVLCADMGKDRVACYFWTTLYMYPFVYIPVYVSLNMYPCMWVWSWLTWVIFVYI